MLRKLLLPLLAFLAFFSLSCALGELAANAANPQSLPDLPPTAQAGDLRLDPAAAGLAAYTAQFQANFSGQDGVGQAYQSALLLSEEYDAAQSARHLLARTETSGQPPASLEAYQLGGTDYLVSTESGGQPGCTQLASGASQPSILRPGDIILSLSRGELVAQGETVGSILADRYKLAGLNLGVGHADSWGGDLWVAQQGGYVLRFTGWAEGQLTLTGQAGRGRLEWSYVLDSAAPVSIDLPQDCRGVDLSDVPLPPDAEGITQTGAQVIFTSPSSSAALLDFFHAALPERGWLIDSESGAGATFTINAVKDGRILQVLVQEQGASCQVTINLR